MNGPAPSRALRDGGRLATRLSHEGRSVIMPKNDKDKIFLTEEYHFESRGANPPLLVTSVRVNLNNPVDIAFDDFFYFSRTLDLLL